MTLEDKEASAKSGQLSPWPDCVDHRPSHLLTSSTIQDALFRECAGLDVSVYAMIIRARHVETAEKRIPANSFVAAISEYDQMLWEDATVGRIHECLMLFESIATSRWFLDKTALVLL